MYADTNAPAPTRPVPKLILHCGARAVDLELVREVETPAATKTWQPIAHDRLIDLVQKTLGATGMRIGAQAHSLSADRQRYFGLMEIINGPSERPDFCMIMGLRNSHDKTFPAGICVGSSVFVCDNLAFSGEIKFGRKHTTRIEADLPRLVERSVGLLGDKWQTQAQRIDNYKACELVDSRVHDLLIQAVDLQICPNQAIPKVLQEWRKPRHADFEPRTAWSLFNAFTEVAKSGNLMDLPKRTQALHGLLDTQAVLGGGVLDTEVEMA